MASDLVCWKKRERRSKEDTGWLSEEVMEAVSTKKDAHRVMRRNNTDKCTNRLKSMKNTEEKAVSKAMREKAEEMLTELKNCKNGMIRLVRESKIDSNGVEGGSDVSCVSVRRKDVWCEMIIWR